VVRNYIASQVDENTIKISFHKGGNHGCPNLLCSNYDLLEIEIDEDEDEEEDYT
jgi:hypothetical protein